eukprot:465284-Pyramimonas_sp.AAC.1
MKTRAKVRTTRVKAKTTRRARTAQVRTVARVSLRRAKDTDRLMFCVTGVASEVITHATADKLRVGSAGGQTPAQPQSEKISVVSGVSDSSWIFMVSQAAIMSVGGIEDDS